MADIIVRSQKITRDELRALVGGNERLMRLLENLTTDVIVTLPDAIQANDLAPVYVQLDSLDDRVSLLEAVCLALDRRLSGMDKLRSRIDDIEKLTIGA